MGPNILQSKGKVHTMTKNVLCNLLPPSSVSFLSSSSTTFLLDDSAPPSWPPRSCTRHAPTLVSLHWLGPLPGILLLQISLQLTSSLPSPLSSNVTFSVTAVLIPLLKTTSCPLPYLCQPPLTFLLFLLHQHLTPSNIYFVLHHLNENRHQSVCSLVPNN